jgi:hypothetical protein
MYIVRYRRHGELNVETKHYGPFKHHHKAERFLATLPALGVCPEGENPGEKWIVDVLNPDWTLIDG